MLISLLIFTASINQVFQAKGNLIHYFWSLFSVCPAPDFSSHSIKPELAMENTRRFT
ncbi:MAG TPA: hypothetical protein PK104_00960 [Spirochaetota bacterium]|jgi:hypothetical protein|nr:hypothetical protein [Spirochaetota bacterium]